MTLRPITRRNRLYYRGNLVLKIRIFWSVQYNKHVLFVETSKNKFGIYPNTEVGNFDLTVAYKKVVKVYLDTANLRIAIEVQDLFSNNTHKLEVLANGTFKNVLDGQPLCGYRNAELRAVSN